MTTVGSLRLLVYSCLLWTLAMAGSQYGNSTFRILYQRKLTPGQPIKLVVSLHGASGPVNMRMEIVDYDGLRMQDTKTVYISNTAETQTLDLEVSENLKRPQYHSSIYLHVIGWGGLQFDRFGPLIWKNKRVAVLVQTDRETYQPGQTVRFRTLVMESDATLSHEKMTVTIKDPLHSMVGQWTREENGEGDGVFEGYMPTAMDLRLGTWTIEAEVDGESTSRPFYVRQYDMPSHEGYLMMKKYGALTETEYKAKVTARTIYGTPLAGRVIVNITVLHRRTNVSLVKEYQLDAKGDAKFTLTKQELMNLGTRTIRAYYAQRGYCLNCPFYITSSTFNVSAKVISEDGEETIDSSTFRVLRSLYYVRFLSHSTPAYKSGLPSVFYFQSTYPDGSANLDAAGTSVNVTVKYWRLTNGSSSYISRYYWRRNPYSELTTLVNQTVLLDDEAKGQIITPPIPENITYYMSVQIRNGPNTYTRSVRPYLSPSKTYMQVYLATPEPAINKLMRVNVMSNKPFYGYTYVVSSKGAIVLNGTVNRNAASTSSFFNIRVTADMAPVLNVLVYYQSDSSEIIADRLIVPLEVFSAAKLNLTFAQETAEPRGKATLTVRADANTKVFFLGHDKRVHRLGNNIRKEEIMSNLIKFDTSSGYYYKGNWRYYYHAYNTQGVLTSAGFYIMTDADVYGSNYQYMPRHYSMRQYYHYHYHYSSRYSRHNLAGPPVKTVKRPETPVEYFLQHLPETWLWDSLDMGNKRYKTYSVDIPNRISTLKLTAFGYNPEKGLSVIDDTVKLYTTKTLFIELYMPDAVTLGETVCIKTYTTNMGEERVTASVSLQKGRKVFKNVLVQVKKGKTKVSYKAITARKSLGVLMPLDRVKTMFCIKPEVVGNMQIRVMATSTGSASDDMRGVLKVKAPGSRKTKKYPMLIEIPASGEFTKTININLPSGVVDGSVRVAARLSGDAIGLALENLDNLLTKPFGCGEQNMIRFAPYVYVIKYLRMTGRLSQSPLADAIDYMFKGYQHQLTYQRYDGSFSAFGNNDMSGSMWLTAFVVKSFSQAKALNLPRLAIEDDVIYRAVGWITENQNADGSFREPGKMIHSGLQMGSASDMRMAAYVTIALTEVNGTFTPKMKILAKYRVRSSLALSVKYLEDNLSEMAEGDSYTACIVAYALALAGSSSASDAVDTMHGMVQTDGSMKYWSVEGEDDSLGIEATAYAMMALKLKGENNKIPPIFRWLNQQRGSRGGFFSTADTMTGLEALAAMTHLALPRNFSPINVNWSWKMGTSKPKTASQQIKEGNVLDTQKIEIPMANTKYADQVTLTATSSGGRRFALAEVIVQYFVEDQSDISQGQGLDIETTVMNNTATSFRLRTCVSRQANTSKGMYVMVIKVPSGYQLDKKSMYGNASKVEIEEDNDVVFYYYESQLDMPDNCPVLTMKTKHCVSSLQSKTIKLNNYYVRRPKFKTTYSVNQYDVCQLAPYYMMCTPPPA
nr:CD109 antigen-like protein [Crepidula fornicata]